MINVLSYLVLFTALSTAAPTPRQNPEKLLQRRIAQKWALSIDRPARHSEPPRINLEAPPVDSTGISPAVSKSSSSQITPIVAGLPAWCSTEITYTNASLDDTASAAIDRLLQYRRAEKLDIKGVGWWQAANAYSSIINQDIVTGTSKHAIDAGDAIKTLITLGDPNESNPVGLRNVFNDDTLWWAIACLDGYKTYKIPELLDEAKRLWEWVRDTSFIVQTGIAPNMGGIQRKKVISDQCGLVDGVYWTTKKSEINVNSIATGLFMQTSARLYELERNPKYLDAALSAGKWLRSHTVDGSLQLVNDDGVDGNTCHVNTGAYTYNTGN